MSDQYAPPPGGPESPPGGYPPHGQPPPGGWQQQYMQPHRGTLILVFGILGLVVCVIFGIVAWVMGNKDLREIREGRMDPAGEGLTSAGRICGMISVGLMVLGLVLFVLGIVFFALAGVSMQQY